jgi:hypothetical protein
MGPAGAVVFVECAVLLGVGAGPGGFVAAVEGAVIQEAECYRVDLTLVRVDNRQAQAAVRVCVLGSGEGNPQS